MNLPHGLRPTASDECEIDDEPPGLDLHDVSVGPGGLGAHVDPARLAGLAVRFARAMPR